MLYVSYAHSSSLCTSLGLIWHSFSDNGQDIRFPAATMPAVIVTTSWDENRSHNVVNWMASITPSNSRIQESGSNFCNAIWCRNSNAFVHLCLSQAVSKALKPVTSSGVLSRHNNCLQLSCSARLAALPLNEKSLVFPKECK